MVVGLLVVVLVLALLTLAARTARAPDGKARADGHTVRQLFQYLLLYGLLVTVAVGLSGLLGRLVEAEVLVRSDRVELARDLAFTVVGGPLLVVVALWSRRNLARDPGEARSPGWVFFATAACLTALVMAMTGLDQALRWATGLADHDGRAVARALVWGGLWAGLWWVDGRVTPREHARVHHLAGSLIGLVTAAAGLSALLTASLRTLTGLDTGAVLAGSGDPITSGAVTVAVGAPVWLLYWVRTAARADPDPLRLAYLLLPGVAGGLVTAIVAASTLLYSVLVWLLGEPTSGTAAEHFDGAPAAAAAAAVGLLVWWYHQAVLATAGTGPRSETRRVYEYLMAGIALLAAAGGLLTVVAALVETAAGPAFVGGSTVNTLLAAATLLVVGAPTWWVYWRRITAAVRDTAAEEVGSPSRRVYLYALFGVGTVAAVVALVVAAYLLFQDIVEGSAGPETLRRMRYAIGALLTAPAIAGYHWTVHRADRTHAPAAARGPRFLLLIGPTDRGLAREVARRTGGRVQAWARADDDDKRDWSADEVLAALGDTTAEEVVVLADGTGLRAIPVHRG
ncbi:DUF5671 domain-containing protein [Pseudonocardia sp.]|uniref:DUF5671 domain-containing protein n=1 Tax=Pseudonocardia sp. TaxID=60912 RepID=UPI002611F7C3|nr:DUF5671 domain-containing protein [Pseudonocardia sp.]